VTAAPRPRILNVDDDEANRYAVSRMLQGAGFEPIEAGTGTEALERARERPDAVLLDLRLPDLDGFEVCRRLRADPLTADLPVVHLTATYGSPDAWAAALDAGADVYLTHPVEPVVLVATLRSLLRGRAAELGRRESEGRSQAVFQNALDAILIADDAGRYVDANPAAAQLLRLSRAEILERRIFDVTPPEERGRAEAAWRAFLADGMAEGTFTLLRGDGTRVEAEFSARARFVPGRHLSILRDVTERKKAERELEESRRRLQDAQHIAHLGSWEWDAASQELLWSDELFRIFGLERAARLRFETFLERVHPDDRGFVAALHEAAVREGEPFEYYGRIVRPSGEVRHVQVRGEAVRGDDGRVARVAGVAHDLTDRARSEDLRRRLADRLIRVQEEERRRLARELHDEIGQALTALQLMIAAAGRSAASRKLVEASGVVGDLLSRVRDLSLDLRPPMLDDFGLAAALHWHVDRFARRTSIQVGLGGAGLDGRFSSEAELAAFRVVQEALTNVARHSGARRAEVAVAWEAGVLTTTVTDTGRGCDGRAALAGTSTGLPGLRERIEMLGGRLEVVSAPRKGTRVTARIPAVRMPMTADAAALPVARARPRAAPPRRRIPRTRRSTNRQGRRDERR
jgi:two-component system, NarL family, sensor histidine kinase UhpB